MGHGADGGVGMARTWIHPVLLAVGSKPVLTTGQLPLPTSPTAAGGGGRLMGRRRPADLDASGGEARAEEEDRPAVADDHLVARPPIEVGDDRRADQLDVAGSGVALPAAVAAVEGVQGAPGRVPAAVLVGADDDVRDAVAVEVTERRGGVERGVERGGLWP